MREVKIIDWCDFCFQKDETYTPITAHWTIGMNTGDKGRPPVRLLAVCEEHNGQLEALHAVWSQVGTLPERVDEAPLPPRTTSSGRTGYRTESECPVCHQIFTTASMVTHIWGRHRPDERPPFPKECEVCGTPTPTPQGYATHRRLAHQFDALSEALAGVPGYGHRQVRQSA